ncbi:kinesin-like protein KIF25 [Boleophthalmus pectinirostris]|uniref:kinesin-like protein KIF25 n=1 Tax=Boleophthalmus pectinirostris TaxID=150288 RepID=UPI00243145C3|nr:kinesin-like protein KIF25 [Boleophthalmus pectinirostris]
MCGCNKFGNWASCLGKLHQSQEKDDSILKYNTQKITRSSLTKLLSEVQDLKHELSEIFGVYVSFTTELEEQSKIILDKVSKASTGDEVQYLQARVLALECSLEEEREQCKVERQRRKELHNTVVELRGNIRVHCRVRPVLPFDYLQPSTSGSGHTPVEEVIQAVSDDTVMVNCMKTGLPVQSKIFEFERVHAPEDSQDSVFEEVKPLLRSLLDGYNVCIMAYGQTGSGKTHTMLGSEPLELLCGAQQEAQQGVVPKAAAELFRLISEKPTESHTVEVAVMEVYNNEVFDLLSQDERGSGGQRRDVVTTSYGESHVLGLTHEPVNSAAEVMHFVNKVLKLRAHSPTHIHMDSSRSHLIITLTISSKSPNALALARRLHSTKKASRKQFWSPQCRRANPPDELLLSPASSRCPSPSPCPSPLRSPSPCHSITQDTFRTKLQLVDLAGSECVGLSGVSGPGLWEVSCINRSLCALSDVLGALAEHRPHIPYRNSKLTHLLQDAIGGDAKLLLMLCVSPTQHFVTESLQSLSLGSRARQVQKSVPRRKNNTLQV